MTQAWSIDEHSWGIQSTTSLNSSFVEIKRSTGSYKIKCPFHQEEDVETDMMGFFLDVMSLTRWPLGNLNEILDM